VNLTLITFSRITGHAGRADHRLLRDGRSPAAEVVIGLAIILTIFRTRRSARWTTQPAQVLTGGHTHMSVRDATVCPAGGLDAFRDGKQ